MLHLPENSAPIHCIRSEMSLFSCEVQFMNRSQSSFIVGMGASMAALLAAAGGWTAPMQAAAQPDGVRICGALARARGSSGRSGDAGDVRRE